MTAQGLLEPTATVRPLRTPEQAPMHPAVAQAIEVMYRRYDEPLTLSDLSREVFISPFHLCRLFARSVGITPGRYLTSVRLFEAKRLLLSTRLTVSDIVCTVGYSSVGTFTTRFTKAVGMTPSQYRDPHVSDLLVAISPHYHRLPSLERLHDLGRSSLRGGGGATITARVDLPGDLPAGDLLVGVFSEPIPQCAPVAFTGLARASSGSVVLDGVPPGRWSVMAVAEHETAGGEHVLSFGVTGRPVTVTGTGTVETRVRARRIRPTDPPIAISLAPTGVSAPPEHPRVAVAHALRAA